MSSSARLWKSGGRNSIKHPSVLWVRTQDFWSPLRFEHASKRRREDQAALVVNCVERLADEHSVISLIDCCPPQTMTLCPTFPHLSTTSTHEQEWEV